MAASIEHQMTEIYVFVDDFLKAHPTLSQWRRSPNSQPALTDAEVITIGLMQGCLGVATLEKTYALIGLNYRSAFPQMCSYQQWIARLHRLSDLIGYLFVATRGLAAGGMGLYLMDSKPLPVCHPIRHGRVRLLREDGAYFSKSSKGWFFGFKLHSVVNTQGIVLGSVLTPANCPDADVAQALALVLDGGVALADLAYRGQPLAQLLAEEAGLLLITPADAGPYRALISTVRQRVETTFSQMWYKFIDRLFSRSWHGLWNTVKLKLLHHNLCQLGLLSA